MAATDPLKWANALVNKPISLSEDYGNLILSTGLAFQQKPQERQGLESPLEYEATSEKNVDDRSSLAPSLQARKMHSLSYACPKFHCS